MLQIEGKKCRITRLSRDFVRPLMYFVWIFTIVFAVPIHGYWASGAFLGSLAVAVVLTAIYLFYSRRIVEIDSSTNSIVIRSGPKCVDSALGAFKAVAVSESRAGLLALQDVSLVGVAQRVRVFRSFSRNAQMKLAEGLAEWLEVPVQPN